MQNVTRGGSIFINNVDADISLSEFTYNQANISGGAIQLNCNPSHVLSCNFTLTNNNFTNNKAIEGGAIAYNLNKPTIVNHSYTSNTASYGQNIGSFPYVL